MRAPTALRLRRIYNLRKPKTNIQILQQHVLLKHRHLMQFMRRHGRETAAEVRAAYVETLSRVLSGHFKAYLTALEPLLVCPAAGQGLQLVQLQLRTRLHAHAALAGDKPPRRHSAPAPGSF